MEMRCYRKILHIKDRVTKEEIHAKIQQAIGPHEDLLTIVKRRKLQWYGHVSRSSGFAKTILQGTVKGGRRQDGQRKRWENNIRVDRPGVRQVPEGSGEQGKMDETGCKIICGTPTTLAVKRLMMMRRRRSVVYPTCLSGRELCTSNREFELCRCCVPNLSKWAVLSGSWREPSSLLTNTCHQNTLGQASLPRR